MFYLLAMQWMPFWGSVGTLPMGIFITEGGGNWGWRETVGKADEHHYDRVAFLAKMGNTPTVCEVPSSPPDYVGDAANT